MKKNVDSESLPPNSTTKKDTIIIKEKPVLVETIPKKSKTKQWSRFFNFLKKRKIEMMK